MTKRIFLLFLFVNLAQSESTNSYGQRGYINLPSALTYKESSLIFGLNRNIPDRKIFLTASPFDWLDATIFYADITGKPYGSGAPQSYKDKGFNVKLNLNEFLNLSIRPLISIGINDIAGTGQYGSEYIAFSNFYKKFEYTFGLGWGELAGKNTFQNPLINLDNDFRFRSQYFKDQGGAFDSNNYFSGEKASFFASTRYKFNNFTNFVMEYDTTKKPGKLGYEIPDTRVNYGIELNLKNYHFRVAVIGNESLNFNFSFNQNFLLYSNINNKNYANNVKNYRDLQTELQKHNIGLQSVSKSNSGMVVEVTENSYQNQYDLVKRVYFSASNLLKDEDYVEVVVNKLGMKSYSNRVDARIRFTKTEDFKESKNQKNIYVVKEKFPIINNSISPVIRNYIAAREGFLFQGLMLENNNEIIFKKNIFLLSNFKYSIYDDFDNLYFPPVDTYPNQVRSDIKKYLNNFGNGIFIGRLELNALHAFNKKHFLRFSAGIFEEMFGGAGYEYLYYPEGSLFSFGVESFFVKKRAYEMDLSFLEYKNYLSRLNMNIIDPYTKIRLKISYGEYLAGDFGSTYTLSRRFNNGVEFGIFFSKTDVTTDQFGEGSFDKGIILKVPFQGFFSKSKSPIKYVWRPLTKDPAALHIKSIDLFDVVGTLRVY